jgi:hypothetical protein
VAWKSIFLTNYRRIPAPIAVRGLPAPSHEGLACTACATLPAPVPQVQVDWPSRAGFRRRYRCAEAHVAFSQGGAGFGRRFFDESSISLSAHIQGTITVPIEPKKDLTTTAKRSGWS